jgi:hypothetical protein
MPRTNVNKDLSSSLILPKIISQTLGYKSIIEILDELKKHNVEEYEFSSELSNIMKILKNHRNQNDIKQQCNIFQNADLARYDLNIKEHIEKITKNRDIKIKSYQYLAMLFTEIYLDYYFQKKDTKDIEDFINVFLNESLNKIGNHLNLEEYTKSDLDKLCYWMATGSGKTLVMHVNYLQYLHYINKFHKNLNNVVLITPNQDLSKQHKKEFDKSEIKSMVVSKDNYNQKTSFIKIIDIHKIKEKAGPNTVSYISFGKNNLILVDEGHRGGTGESWIDYRNKIAKEGFTLEYSATFQDTKKGNDYSSDYKKTILYDYSYKYYHSDGYGKDYDISNVTTKKGESKSHYEELIMLANLLSYYEQKKLFLRNQNHLESILKIEDPLWILIGSKVVDRFDKKTGTYKDKDIDKKTLGEISKFIKFLNDLKVKRSHFIELIEEIYDDKTLLRYKDTNQSFFENKYEYLWDIILKEFDHNFEKLFQDILKTVFYSSNNDSKLVLYNIKKSDGEIGLCYSDNTSKYFGLIYVGKKNDKKIIDSNKEEGIKTRTDSLSESYFQKLNDKSQLNILIGAKKFIEGWDNYRISSMLLMNFAKNQGVSPIQLFGRGVRLHGYNNSMKRSEKIDTPIKNISLKKYLPILETLNVFGIDAKYMETFRDQLEDDIEFYIEKEINTNVNHTLITNHELKCIIEDKDSISSFRDENIISLMEDPNYHKDLSLDKHVQAVSSNRERIKEEKETIPYREIVNKQHFSIVNWEYILSELRRYKRNKKYSNLSIPKPEDVKKILLNKLDSSITFKGSNIIFNEKVKNIDQLKFLKDSLERIYLELLKNHMKKVYTKHFRSYYEKQLKPATLNPQKHIIEKYKIRIYLDKNGEVKGDRHLKPLLNFIKNSESKSIDLKEITKEHKDFNTDKILIEFDKHLYFPLLISSSRKDKGDYDFSPTGLNTGEKQFINVIKKQLSEEIFKKKDIVLLRNHENQGLGYYLSTEKYYPDFILWIITKNKQKILFIDPKGLVHPDEEKINFHRVVKEDIEPKIKKNYPTENIELYSYILSRTPKQNIPIKEIKQKPDEHGIYFLDDSNWFKNICKDAGIDY